MFSIRVLEHAFPIWPFGRNIRNVHSCFAEPRHLLVSIVESFTTLCHCRPVNIPVRVHADHSIKYFCEINARFQHWSRSSLGVVCVAVVRRGSQRSKSGGRLRTSVRSLLRVRQHAVECGAGARGMAVHAPTHEANHLLRVTPFTRFQLLGQPRVPCVDTTGHASNA